MVGKSSGHMKSLIGGIANLSLAHNGVGLKVQPRPATFIFLHSSITCSVQTRRAPLLC
jgi:hypothetical protein